MTKKANQSTSRRTRVQSVVRAMRLLRAFTDQNPELGVGQLSQHLALSKTVVFRLLATLGDEGFIEQNPENQKYRLGGAIFEIASNYANHNDLVRLGDEILRELVASTQHTAQLGILEETHILSLVVVPSPRMVRINLRPGDRKPAHATATGKVLLAALTDDAVRALYPTGKMDPMTKHTIVKIEPLLKELVQVRERGYALNCGESSEEIMAVAAPVCNYQGRRVAGLSLSWTAQSVPESEVDGLIDQVVNCAKRMSQRLGNSLALY